MNIKQPEKQGDILFVSPQGAQLFSTPEAITSCYSAADIPAALQRVEEHISQGFHVAGFLAYEAGWAFLERTIPKQYPELPLLWFGAYKKKETLSHPKSAADTIIASASWQPDVEHDAYLHAIDRIRAYIGAGDTYQVNFTFPMKKIYKNDPLQWFWQLYAAQPTDHAAYLDTGRHKILSLSPELFFNLSGDKLTTRPMKGTLPRGLYLEQDEQARLDLFQSEKDRAENVMIVDLLRNDMGKISQTNSVRVESLFDVEKYATVWQMTSNITSKTNASFSEIMTALFPSGSVTGAPKLRAMEIIDKLEPCPRGIYCGAIGWWSPEREASFNVAIRTITLDTHTQQATYPVGGGITWYSSPEGEYAECLAKAQAVKQPPPDFSLLESLLYEDTFFLLEEHLNRLCQSANYFDIPLDKCHIRDSLSAYGATLPKGRWKVRLVLHKDGAHHIESAPAPIAKEMKVALSASPVATNNVFLYHKTTHRTAYEEAMKNNPGMDDVLLWNEAGELTESTLANIVADLDGKLITPPISCGLLAGVMREHLLSTGKIEEGIIHKDDLKRATKLWLINSVRVWIPTKLMKE